MFSKTRGLAVGLTVAIAITGTLAATAASTTASAATEKPTATDVGVSATEIHIAVIADVDNPIVPGIFQGAVDGVRGAAKYLNSKAWWWGRRRAQVGRRLPRRQVERQRRSQRDDHRVRPGPGHGRYQCHGARQRRGHGELPGSSRRGDRHPRLLGDLGCGDRVLDRLVPDQPELHGLRDQRAEPADLPVEPGRVHPISPSSTRGCTAPTCTAATRRWAP